MPGDELGRTSRSAPETLDGRKNGERRMKRRFGNHLRWAIGRGGAMVATALAGVALVAAPAAQAEAPAGHSFGDLTFSAGLAGPGADRAGGHPDLVTEIRVPTEEVSTGREPVEDMNELMLDLPQGLLGDLSGAPTCTVGQMAAALCSVDDQVGTVALDVPLFNQSAFGHTPDILMPIYNLRTESGDEVARLGFKVGFVDVLPQISIKLREEGDYGMRATLSLPRQQPIAGFKFTIWGVPADPVHDADRIDPTWGCILDYRDEFEVEPATFGGVNPCPPLPPPSLPRRAFLSDPTTCGTPMPARLLLTGFSGSVVDRTVSLGSMDEASCAAVPFEPSLSVATDAGARAGRPAGLDVAVKVPQTTNPDAAISSHLKDTEITLPPGVVLNPPAADGLVACTDQELRIGEAGEDRCPDAAKVGEVEIDAPAVEATLKGGIYIRPSLPGNLFRIALTAYGAGVNLKIGGEIHPDPQTGRLVAEFDDTPQLPFAELRTHFFGGQRAVLSMPAACGTQTASARFTPWARPDDPVTAEGYFTVDQGCGGQGGFGPGFEAGTANPAGGSFSPFVLRVTRGDGEQNISRIAATLPEGLLAKLAGVPLCGDADAAAGSCPAASQVGSTTVGVGSGGSPLYVPQPGRPATAVYLAGPYQGAPYSLVTKVPAQAGPFDLGTVLVRSALQIDPGTTRVTVKSDPLPQIQAGVPLTYRDVRVDIDRPGFTVNPTSCEPMQVESVLTSAQGASVTPASRFQAANCAVLGFSPKVALRLSGAPPRRGGNPALRAVVTPPAGQANIGRATVVLPDTELLEQAHIKTVCTRVQFAAGQCPAGSVYGHAKAWTPLLDKPLEGPVYLLANGGERKLPDLVADLNGSIHVVLTGYIDSVRRHGSPRIRTRFLSVPDAPISRFVLDMQKGMKSLLANNTNLCKARPRAEASLTGQNGKAYELRPPVKVDGCGKGGKKKWEPRGVGDPGRGSGPLRLSHRRPIFRSDRLPAGA